MEEIEEIYSKLKEKSETLHRSFLDINRLLEDEELYDRMREVAYRVHKVKFYDTNDKGFCNFDINESEHFFTAECSHSAGCGCCWETAYISFDPEFVWNEEALVDFEEEVEARKEYELQKEKQEEEAKALAKKQFEEKEEQDRKEFEEWKKNRDE